MKYATAYYLFLLYCTVLLRCAIPVACDVLSHIFNEEEHLATIHALYGNNHLQKEVATSENDNTKNQNSIKYEDQMPVHLSVEKFSLAYLVKSISKFFSPFVLLKIPDIHLRKPFQPPRPS